ncbi:MAG: hypothetical protein K2Y20_16085, partial [Sphingomonas sp.]|nr:hypothetical protein [Sphingomonas sp.]
MTQPPLPDPNDGTAPDPAPLFILSFRQRDEIAALAGRSGWQAIAARRSDGAVERYNASGAALAVVDARGALSEGLAATAALGGLATPANAPIVVDHVGPGYAAISDEARAAVRLA